MFSRRRPLDRRRKYSKEYFHILLNQLKEGGISDISIILPHNYETVDPKNSEVSPEDFIKKERNYAAIIVVAKSKERKEILKVLFVNSSAKAIFVDDTFPSAMSEPPSLYFQSPDPARAFALFEYFFEFLNQGSLRSFVQYSIIQLMQYSFSYQKWFILEGTNLF